MIVVDTNVICYRWMPSALSAAADQAWEIDSHWIAPLLWRSEFRNAIAGALRHRLIAAEAALEIVENAEAQFAGREYLVSSRAVLPLITASRASAYDCEFVALAQEHRVPLITADRQLLNAFRSVAVSLEQFVSR